jgi:hypothetical protein
VRMSEDEVSVQMTEALWDDLLEVLDEALDRSRSIEKDARLQTLRAALLDQLPDREQE